MRSVEIKAGHANRSGCVAPAVLDWPVILYSGTYGTAALRRCRAQNILWAY
jgi:hypothetical protein